MSEITDNCGEESGKNFGNKDDGYHCKLCTDKYCVQCGLTDCKPDENGQGRYVDSKSCTCKSCKTDGKLDNCTSCKLENTEVVCTKCEAGNGSKGDGYYLQKEGSSEISKTCKECEGDYFCDDGILEKAQSICDNAPTGYFCEGNKLRACSDKHGVTCSTCTANKCLSCSLYYYLDNNGSCKSCGGGCVRCSNSEFCDSCVGTTIRNSSGKCISCSTFMPKCNGCTGTIENPICNACIGGYYVANNGKECKPCSSISNCYTCTNDGKCSSCYVEYYPNSSGTCSLCNVQNCARCDSNGRCAICNQNYHLEGGICKSDNNTFHCSDSNFMEIPVANKRLCITRKNMGDDPSLIIPSTVQVVNAGSYCYVANSKCCWKGKTASTCSSVNGDYSGCERTVCDWKTAKEICEKFNYGGKKWRLMTKAEAQTIGQNFINYTQALGNNGMQLCFHHGGELPNISQCVYGQGPCKGAATSLAAALNRCMPHFVWIESTGCVFGYESRLIIGTGSIYDAGASVRCVTEMEDE